MCGEREGERQRGVLVGGGMRGWGVGGKWEVETRLKMGLVEKGSGPLVSREWTGGMMEKIVYGWASDVEHGFCVLLLTRQRKCEGKERGWLLGLNFEV